MAEPTLVQVFGAGATQDANTLTIQKSALATTGLTTSATNSAERLLVAIILLAQQYLTQSNFDANIDQSILIADGFSNFTIRGSNNASYRTDTRTISLSKLDTGATIDPDDY